MPSPTKHFHDIISHLSQALQSVYTAVHVDCHTNAGCGWSPSARPTLYHWPTASQPHQNNTMPGSHQSSTVTTVVVQMLSRIYHYAYVRVCACWMQQQKQQQLAGDHHHLLIHQHTGADQTSTQLCSWDSLETLSKNGHAPTLKGCNRLQQHNIGCFATQTCHIWVLADCQWMEHKMSSSSAKETLFLALEGCTVQPVSAKPHALALLPPTRPIHQHYDTASPINCPLPISW